MRTKLALNLKCVKYAFHWLAVTEWAYCMTVTTNSFTDLGKRFLKNTKQCLYRPGRLLVQSQTLFSLTGLLMGFVCIKFCTAAGYLETVVRMNTSYAGVLYL